MFSTAGNVLLVYILIDAVDETDENLVEFAIGGICNCCLGKYILLEEEQRYQRGNQKPSSKKGRTIQWR